MFLTTCTSIPKRLIRANFTINLLKRYSEKGGEVVLKSNQPSLRSLEKRPVSWKERLPKVYKNIDQPPNSKLIKLAMVGVANSGKSSLVNLMLQSPLATVSDRPQTTRRRSSFVLTLGDLQVVLLDTPGITTTKGKVEGGKTKLKLNRELVTSAWSTCHEADLVLILMDLYKLVHLSTFAEDFLIEQLNRLKLDKPVLVLFNKLDLVQHLNYDQQVKPVVDKFLSRFETKEKRLEPILFSTKENPDLTPLLNWLQRNSKLGNWIVPKTVQNLTSDYELVVEAIREAYFSKLKEALPYQFQQQNLNYRQLDDQNNTLMVEQLILLKQKKHANIFVGRGGQVINSVVQEATLKLRQLLKRKVKLYLDIKVVKQFPKENFN